jgi:hypothetical protein
MERAVCETTDCLATEDAEIARVASVSKAKVVRGMGGKDGKVIYGKVIWCGHAKGAERTQ